MNTDVEHYGDAEAEAIMRARGEESFLRVTGEAVRHTLTQARRVTADDVGEVLAAIQVGKAVAELTEDEVWAVRRFVNELESIGR